MNIKNLTNTDASTMKAVIRSSAKIHKFGDLPTREKRAHNSNVNYLKSRFGKKWMDVTWDFMEREGIKPNDIPVQKPAHLRMSKKQMIVAAMSALIILTLAIVIAGSLL